MGISKAEIRLRRLLAASPKQKNQVKLMHYVASMREQLAVIVGDSVQQGLSSITPAKAQEYAQCIDEIADRIEHSTLPTIGDERPDEEVQHAEESSGYQNRQDSPGLEESILVPQSLSPTLRRRRPFPQQDGNKPSTDKDTIKLDATAQQLIQRNRQLQDDLTDEMVVYAEQMKLNSRAMEKSLRDTDNLLDKTDEAIERGLAATNRANLRAGTIYSKGFMTGCYTWLILAFMILIFTFMVLIIRIT